MGVDYVQRKANKKAHKRVARDGAKNDDKGTTRDRKKKVTPKRRAGVCYGQPVVTLDDKRATDDEDSDGNAGEEYYDVLSGAQLNLEAEATAGRESNRTKRLRSAVPVKKCGQFEKGAPNAKADAREKKRDLQKLQEADFAAGKVKLSTAISLGRPSPAAAAPAAPSGAAAGAKAAKGCAAKRGAKQEADATGGEGEGEGTVDMPADNSKVTAEALQPFHHVIRSYMAMQKFLEPTEVQAKTWPAACKGIDILAKAQPGAGKTLAFLLPLACQLVDAGHGRHTEPLGPLLIALAPTRELALQTHIACKPLVPLFGLRSTCIYGGVDKDTQSEALRKLPHILVATPGRLLDMMDDMRVDLRHARAVVLDECDKMLSLGFKAQLDRLHDVLMQPRTDVRASAIVVTPDADGKRLKKKAKHGDEALVPAPAPAAESWARPQTILLSATMPESAQEEADRWLSKQAKRIEVEASPLSISKTITQIVQVCAEHKKPAKLLKHLEAIKGASKGERSVPRVLVFCNRIKTVRFVNTELRKAEFKSVMLHGDRSQTERENAVRDFKAGKCQILVATDVAARGLHVKNLPYIVNYDFPGNLETYIHRVGRTGRLQAYGHAFTFLTRNLARIAPDLVTCLKEHDQSLDPNLVQLAEAYTLVLEKLGPEALRDRSMTTDVGDVSDDEAPKDAADLDGMVLLADDIDEGLDRTANARAGGGKGKAGRAAPAHEGRPANSAAGLLPPLQGAQREKPAFVPSARFSGRRTGYVFQKGPKGLGFYLDTPPVVTFGGKKGKHQKALAQAAAIEAARPAVPSTRTKTNPKPAASKKPKKVVSPYDDDDEDEVAAKIPKGILGQGKSGELAALGGGVQKKKAIPGRLRKKLNKMKADAK